MDPSSCILRKNVTGNNLKQLAAIFHLMQKVGKDFVIEKGSDGYIVLRALNDLNSVFVAIEFKDNFFSNIRNDDDYDMVENDVAFACKLATKPICTIFRNLKKILNLCIYQQSRPDGQNGIVFQFHSIEGIKKIHYFSYQDCDVVQAVFDEDHPNINVLQSQPKIFSQILEHLHQCPEIIFEASPDSFFIKTSHSLKLLTNNGRSGGNKKTHLNKSSSSIIDSVSSAGYNQKMLKTDLSIDITEFDVYNFNYQYQQQSQDDNGEQEYDMNNNGPVEIVFCSKEFRSLLAFCEVTEIPTFSVHFGNGGAPMKMKCESQLNNNQSSLFRVDMIAATLPGTSSTATLTTPAQSQHQQQSGQQQQSNAQSAAPSRRSNCTTANNARNTNNNSNNNNAQNQRSSSSSSSSSGNTRPVQNYNNNSNNNDNNNNNNNNYRNRYDCTRDQQQQHRVDDDDENAEDNNNNNDEEELNEDNTRNVIHDNCNDININNENDDETYNGDEDIVTNMENSTNNNNNNNHRNNSRNDSSNAKQNHSTENYNSNNNNASTITAITTVTPCVDNIKPIKKKKKKRVLDFSDSDDDDDE